MEPGTYLGRRAKRRCTPRVDDARTCARVPVGRRRRRGDHWRGGATIATRPCVHSRCGRGRRVRYEYWPVCSGAFEYCGGGGGSVVGGGTWAVVAVEITDNDGGGGGGGGDDLISTKRRQGHSFSRSVRTGAATAVPPYGRYACDSRAPGNRCSPAVPP